MMRCIVSLLLLLLCACGEDSPTSNDGASVDKASLIPGEYEGVYYTSSIVYYPSLDDTARGVNAEYITAAFNDTAYTIRSPRRYCWSGDLSKTHYYAREDTLILVPNPAGTGMCSVLEKFGGVFLYEHNGEIMNLTQIGEIYYIELITTGWYYALYTDEDFFDKTYHPYVDEMTKLYYMRKK